MKYFLTSLAAFERAIQCRHFMKKFFLDLYRGPTYPRFTKKCPEKTGNFEPIFTGHLNQFWLVMVF